MPLAGLAIGPPSDPLGGRPAAPDVVSVLRRRRGRGDPLPATIASDFGEQLGTDLRAVRVHTDAEADRVSRDVQATAFTHGSDVYFSRGAYAPHSQSGRMLIAHELAHVAQGAAAASGSSTPSIGRVDDPAERDADRVAHDVVKGLQTVARTMGTPGVQRSTIRRDVSALKSRFEAIATNANTPGPSVGNPNRPASATAKQRFDTTVSVGAPTDETEAAARMGGLRRTLTRMSPTERDSISTDTALMAKARTFVGPKEYMTLVAAVGMFHRSGEADEVNHMSGAEADRFIQTEMAKRGHLASYIVTAAKAGKTGAGFVATVSHEDWMKVRDVQYANQGDNLSTNAFIANQHADRPAILHHKRGTRSTAVHESMHRYSESGLRLTYGAPLNEAVTEYFTRLIVNDDGTPVTAGGQSSRTPYQRNFEFVRDHLIPILGPSKRMQEVALAEIYFSGTMGLLKAKFEAALKKAGSDDASIATAWTTFDTALTGGTWTDAAAVLPAP